MFWTQLRRKTFSQVASCAYLLGFAVAGLFPLQGATTTPAPDVDAAREAFETGRYDEAISIARNGLSTKEDIEDWGTLLSRALFTRGRYAEALSAATNALSAEPRSLRLRWCIREALPYNGLPESAVIATNAEIQRLFTSRYWQYRNARDFVTFGRVSREAGMEPKLLLDKVYDAAKKLEPKFADSYLASGELALEKHDYALAAKFFQEGLKQIPNNADLSLGLARAYAPSEPALMLEAVLAALERNSNHIDSLLLLADHDIDAEDYAAAEKLLARVEAVNPSHPEAWAYRAVLAHLKNQSAAETKARAEALKFWPGNPRVDHLIGQKLSQKYRFAEGSSYQRRALTLRPAYLPAKSQLAQDLLRLGEEDEGWKLAEEVQQEDNYDVAANNLVTLRGVLAKFQAVTNQHFLVRMEPREAGVFGKSALDLLERARQRLTAAYGLELSKPVLIELFNEEKDFAVRTFGMPDNDGFLGVCFGNVITANSPSARPGSHFNWQSMLWHEFCHVITLQLTKNKMPRWLSEGISVYEERQVNPAWGERLNPRYREMLLGKDLTPVSKLSGAFLAPKSPLHLQFAYYESSLVVQFITERFGREKLLAILHDLGKGEEINAALSRHTTAIGELEKQFEAYAHEVASAMAPGVDFERPTPDKVSVAGRGRRSDRADRNTDDQIPGAAWAAWASTRPTNYWVVLRKAEGLLDDRRWSEARPMLEELVRLYPGSKGSSSPDRLLAVACRELGDTNAERQVLTRLAAKDDQAAEAFLRLMELAAPSGDWPEVLTNAHRYLAVNPMSPAPYRHLARASEALGRRPPAIEAWDAVLALDPPNPGEVHFQLARLLEQEGSPAAYRHVLQALEEAPRHREALRLFQKLRQENSNTATANDATANAAGVSHSQSQSQPQTAAPNVERATLARP